jgi:hypothetical protein
MTVEQSLVKRPFGINGVRVRCQSHPNQLFAQAAAFDSLLRLQGEFVGQELCEKGGVFVILGKPRLLF